MQLEGEHQGTCTSIAHSAQCTGGDAASVNATGQSTSSTLQKPNWSGIVDLMFARYGTATSLQQQLLR
jgi:hypothetical protein